MFKKDPAWDTKVSHPGEDSNSFPSPGLPEDSTETKDFPYEVMQDFSLLIREELRFCEDWHLGEYSSILMNFQLLLVALKSARENYLFQALSLGEESSLNEVCRTRSHLFGENLKNSRIFELQKSIDRKEIMKFD